MPSAVDRGPAACGPTTTSIFSAWCRLHCVSSSNRANADIVDHYVDYHQHSEGHAMAEAGGEHDFHQADGDQLPVGGDFLLLEEQQHLQAKRGVDDQNQPGVVAGVRHLHREITHHRQRDQAHGGAAQADPTPPSVIQIERAAASPTTSGFVALSSTMPSTKAARAASVAMLI